MSTRTRLPLLLLLAAALLLPAAGAAHAQRREHLTAEEIELIRDNQELDKRTAVFVKAAERRLLAITDPAGAARQFEKEKEKWGEVKGTRAQLVYDLSKILDEAVVNIDDVHERAPESPLLRRALFNLAEAAGRFLPRLTPLRDSTEDERERETLERAIEAAQEIVEAARAHKVSADDLKAKDERKGKKGN
ncbi:MAG TPA: hypothetical protein VEY09_11770 [Pyrinomonadaceae bacterium]|nr:hypothetical protein [Pyrinomonadaceae bacterium]